MAIIYANRPKYELSMTVTIYSRTQASDGTMFTKTKHRPFSLRNLQGETLEDQVQQAIRIMNEVAQELHYLTGFGIDKGRVKHGSTTIEEVIYPELAPSSTENLWYSYAIVLKFVPHVYKWVQGKVEKSAIDETLLHEGWHKQAVWTGGKSSFKIPVAKEAGFFRLGSYGIEYEKNDAVFTRFIGRFREDGHLCYGRSQSFGTLAQVSYDYWPQAKKPQKYMKKLPRKSRLATQPTDTTEYVYIIKISRKNIYKIGKSDDPQGRLQSLQTASPHKLHIVHTFKADNASAAEEALHEILHKHRMEGEWFNIPKPQSERLLAIERFENTHFWIHGKGIPASQVFDSVLHCSDSEQ